MLVRTTFPHQFFAITSPIDDRYVILAGGLDPLNGQRSAFQASVACFDYLDGCIVWQNDVKKSHPFRAVACTDQVAAAVLPSNFVRCPKGLFLFDRTNGEALTANHVESGWNFGRVDTCQNRLCFSWASNLKSHLRVIAQRGGTLEEMVFPYDSTDGGKIIENVFAIDEQDYLAIFRFVASAGDKHVSYSIERWSMNGNAPQWTTITRLDNAVRNGSVLLTWTSTGPQLDVEIFSIANGTRQVAFKLGLPDVVTITPIDAESYAVLAVSGAFVMDIAAKCLKQLAGMNDNDFQDLGALAVDARAGKLLVVTAGNFQRPATHLFQLDL